MYDTFLSVRENLDFRRVRGKNGSKVDWNNDGGGETLYNEKGPNCGLGELVDVGGATFPIFVKGYLWS